MNVEVNGVRNYEIKFPVYETFIEGKKCICANNRLEDGFMYLY